MAELSESFQKVAHMIKLISCPSKQVLLLWLSELLSLTMFPLLSFPVDLSTSTVINSEAKLQLSLADPIKHLSKWSKCTEKARNVKQCPCFSKKWRKDSEKLYLQHQVSLNYKLSTWRGNSISQRNSLHTPKNRRTICIVGFSKDTMLSKTIKS